MAKTKKPSKQLILQPIKKIQPWASNKIAETRKLGEHRAAKAARRWGAPAGVALVAFLFFGSFFLPKDGFQRAKSKLLRNPADFQAQITLAEKLLANNQLEEAEKVLLLAQSQISQANEQVLGKQTNPGLEELWQKKIYADPQEISKMISAWEKIIEEKPNYRDGYLQLAYFHYLLYENEKAQDYLGKAVELDPNYELARELEKIIGD